MARLGETFDASTVEPNKPFEPLPPGRYVVQIVNSEMRPTKDGMGQYLWLELDVLEGAHAGRKLFDRLNLVNKQPDDGRDRAADALGNLPCDRPDAGRRQRAAASHPADCRRQGAAAEERLRRPELAPLHAVGAAARAAARRSARASHGCGSRANGFSGARDKNRHSALAARQLIDDDHA
jgi:hypothetical protein